MGISRRGLLGVTAGAAASVGLAAAPADATVERRRIGRGVIRVATFNIHYGAGKDEVFDLEHTAEVIEAIDPDVIALQEVDRYFRDRSNWEDEPTLLGRLLQMHYAYGANIDMDPLQAGRPRRQYGTAILSRWPIREWRNTHLPQYPDSEPRGLLEAVISLPGKRVRLANTHMQHTSDEEWQEQADAIVGLLADSAEPVILTGDTNAMPDFPGMKTFTDRYDDVWARVGIGDGLSTPPYRFDYVLVPPNADVRQAWLVCSDASDHMPLVTDILLP